MREGKYRILVEAEPRPLQNVSSDALQVLTAPGRGNRR